METRGREDANSGGEARMRRRVPGSSVRSSPATRPGRFTRLSRESRGTPGILAIATPSSNALSNNRARNPRLSRAPRKIDKLHQPKVLHAVRFSCTRRLDIQFIRRQRSRTCAIPRRSRMNFTVSDATYL